MQQLELDNILSGSENALTDRQTDRQTAADAGRENSQGKESVKACGRYEQGTAYIKAIYTEALEEGIRCAMCTNTIKSDTGCDGGCIVDTKMYNKVMTEINSRLLRRPPKKGHWVKEESPFGWDGYSYQCSECGRSIHLDTEMEDLEDYPYCHCGAKMQDDMTELTIEDLEALEQEQDKPMVEIDLYSVIKQKYIERDVIDKIIADIIDEKDFAYADFDRYKEEVLGAESDELPDDDFRYGMERAIEIIYKHKAESEGKE